jgi:hypothetical protein
MGLALCVNTKINIRRRSTRPLIVALATRTNNPDSISDYHAPGPLTGPLSKHRIFIAVPRDAGHKALFGFLMISCQYEGKQMWIIHLFC